MMSRSSVDPSQPSIRQFATPLNPRSNARPASAVNGPRTQRRNGLAFTAISTASRPSGTLRPPFSIGLGESRGVLCAVIDSNDVSRSVGLAFVNIPIAEAVLTAVSDTQFYPKTIHKIQMMEASRILMPPTPAAPQQSGLALRAHVEEELEGVTILEMAKHEWSEHDGLQALRRVAFKADLPALEFAVKENFYTICAFAAALKHISDDLGITFDKQSVRIKYQPPADAMMISLPTMRSLELVRNAQSDHPKDCLFGLLNHMATPMGSRMLRSNILQPSTQVSLLNARFDAVSELIRSIDLCSRLESGLHDLKSLGDVEQLLTKLVILPKNGSIYESEQAINNILKLKTFLTRIPNIYESLTEATSNLLVEIRRNCQADAANEILAMIADTIDRHATFATKPLELRNQRVHTIKPEVSASLDIQRKLYEDFNGQVHNYINNLEGELGVKITLKYTDTRKFYLRVNVADFGPGGPPPILVNRIRARNYIECQTLKLVEYNERISQAVNSAMAESDEVIKILLADIRPHVCELFKYCESIALVDLLVSYTGVSKSYNYSRPEFHDNGFSVVSARHPILDSRGYDKCVPNDYFITDETRLQIITGQNMSGKSTYIRAIAMIQIMAQIGCYVPSAAAQMPVIHSLFARVSTDDLLEANLSTFSVEMREMAFILRNVNNKSLVLVDELGRATSTRDGLAIATAMTEALLQCGATVFFATHFIELARGLANRTGVVNRHLQTETHHPVPGTTDVPVIKMLYRVGEGTETAVNYGISLAKAIGFPASFIARAETVAAELRRRAAANRRKKHEIEETKRRKLLRGLVQQLRLAQQSQADDEELWKYLRQIHDDFWTKMLGTSGSDETDEEVLEDSEDEPSDRDDAHEENALEEDNDVMEDYAVKEPINVASSVGADDAADEGDFVILDSDDEASLEMLVDVEDDIDEL